MMKIVHEVRFKLSTEDYLYIKGLAAFYYDHRIIPRPSVHALAKSATIRIANQWIEQESIALEMRKQRKQLLDRVSEYKT